MTNAQEAVTHVRYVLLKAILATDCDADEICRRAGMSLSRVNRILFSDAEFYPRDVASLANAAECDISFHLVDRKNPNRIFTGSGVRELAESDNR